MAEDPDGGDASVSEPTSAPSRTSQTNVLGRELWGDAVWGTVLLVILIPEVWAAASGQKVWPTISGTIGHLEYLRDWVALIVAGVIVWVAFEVARYPAGALPGPEPSSRITRKQTAGGRATVRRQPTGEVPALMLGAGVVMVVFGSVLAAELDPSDLYVLGYVLYGSIALFCVAVPSVVAFVWAKDVPFPTFFRTLAYLERRVHFLPVVVFIGLVILLVHLALYPWPNVFHVLKGPHPTSP